MDELVENESRYVIRALGPEDAERVGPLHVRVWQQTYAGLMPEDALAGLDVGQRVTMWRRWLGDEQNPTALGAFERSSGELVGWVTVAPARDDDAPAATELWVLNLERAHHGSGLARALLRAALALDEPAYLWVVEGNERAIAFYRKEGFVLDGVSRVEDEGNRDLRMVRGSAPRP